MISTFSSPGMPKMNSTPSFSRQRTSSSAAFTVSRFAGVGSSIRLARQSSATSIGRFRFGSICASSHSNWRIGRDCGDGVREADLFSVRSKSRQSRQPSAQRRQTNGPNRRSVTNLPCGGVMSAGGACCIYPEQTADVEPGRSNQGTVPTFAAGRRKNGTVPFAPPIDTENSTGPNQRLPYRQFQNQYQ